MNVFEFLALLAVTGCITGVIFVDRFLGPARRAAEHNLRLAEQRIQEQQLRIAELERHNGELREQLEWHRKLLEAQDTVLKQLGPPYTRA
jgi:hypothetical protein